MNKNFIFILIILVFFSLPIALANQKTKVPVLITTSSEIIATTITEEEIIKLESNKEIKKIELAPIIKANLFESTKIIGATDTWPIQINEINLTGIDESICIIDTGIDFTHPDLIGRNKSCIIDCYNKLCEEDCTIGDWNGHGTHVAGITAASGSITGIAPNSNLISLRVLNATGAAHIPNGVFDIRNAINWCTDNKVDYNISVISMSFGSVNLFSGYCDSEYGSIITSAINSATQSNITVVASTGNQGSQSQISFPACVQNVVAVSGTDDNDNIAGFNYNSITDLFAPGIQITSTFPGGYITWDGTSMSAPHVSASFALLNQFNRLKGIHHTPMEMQSVLQEHGKNINSPEGLNFTRINIFDAINFLNSESKDLILETILKNPLDNSLTNNNESNFTCQSTSEHLYELTNVTFHLWNSSSQINNQTINLSSFNSTSTFFYSLPYETNYHWNCLSYNNQTNFTSGSDNFTLTYETQAPNVTSISPEDNFTTTEPSSLDFSFHVLDNQNLSQCELRLNNQTVSHLNNVSNNNTNTISFSPSAGVYRWKISCTDFANNIGYSTLRNLQVHSPPSSGGGGGGGGGGGRSSNSVSSPTSTILNNTNTTQNNPTIPLDQEDLKEKPKEELNNFPTITTHTINEPTLERPNLNKGVIALLLVLSFLITTITQRLSKTKKISRKKK